MPPVPQVLALGGSERPGGNTDQVLTHIGGLVLGRGLGYRVIHLRDLPVQSGCGPCGDCNVRTAECVVDDGVAGAVAAMAEADGIVYASPVHGFGMASLMQAFIERAGVGHLRFRRPLAGKAGLAVVTGRRFSHEDVHDQLMRNMMLNRMVVAGSGFPAVVRGGRPGSAWEDTEGVAHLDAATLRFIELVRFIRSADDAGVRLGGTELAVNERLETPVNQGGTP